MCGERKKGQIRIQHYTRSKQERIPKWYGHLTRGAHSEHSVRVTRKEKTRIKDTCRSNMKIVSLNVDEVMERLTINT